MRCRFTAATLRERSLSHFSLALATLLCTAAVSPANQPPAITTLPEVNTTPLVADNATPYTVSMTASDPDGYNDLRCLRILFNYTESGGQTSTGRGYLAWGKTDGDIAQYGGNWIFADATGGGRWAYMTDSWGGTAYLTPLNCTTTAGGLASGDTGSRTVNFTFTVKSVWAFYPLTNDADAWIADSAAIIGWRDATADFDVVAAPCGIICQPPRPPILSNPSANTLDVSIHPDDSVADLFALRVWPSVGGKRYVQSDGTLGLMPQWRSRSAWGTRTIQGLMWSTSYEVSARAARFTAGYCPSSWSTHAEAATSDAPPVVNHSGGTPFSPWVRGQNPYRSIPASGYATVWSLAAEASGRGLAGGLDADTYDWRNIHSGANWGLTGGYFTTLEFLQHARDYSSAPLFTANMFGGGYRDPAQDDAFVCQTDNPEGLAADWVRYANFIVRNYRQGQEGSLSGEDLRVYNSIVDWGGKAKLLSPAEEVVPAIQYWEIGNEPELGGLSGFLLDHYLGPAAYRDRYKSISQAMLAVDPTLKIGPCLMTPTDPNSGSGQWLAALADDAQAPIDFVGYHPYYSAIKANWDDPEGMTTALREYKAYLKTRSDGIRTIMSQHGRSGYDLMATEWNPLSWDATGAQQRSMAMALGLAEGCFTFAEEGVLAAHFWEHPQSKLGARDMFAGLRDHMGNVLVTSGEQMGLAPADTNFRVYVTRDSTLPNTIMIWGLNFNNNQPVELTMALSPCRPIGATLKRYGKPGGSSLTDGTGMVWQTQDITAGFDTAAFTLTMPSAEAVVLILDIEPTVAPDMDRDGDVDLDDFGLFQACLSGPSVIQDKPACRDARLDGDRDVDHYDLADFLACFSGADIPANLDCAP